MIGGWTLLHIGAKKGDVKEVKNLLNKGMDVNVAAWGLKSQGVTPLHLAAEGAISKSWMFCLNMVPTLMPELRVHAAGHLFALQPRRDRKAVKFLVVNGAFLLPDMEDNRFNPPLHYCPGLEWAYEEMKQLPTVRAFIIIW